MSDFAPPREIGPNGKIKYGKDGGLIVTFEWRPVLMEAISKELGHPHYEDRIFTNIVSPGNTKTVWDHQTKGIAYYYNDDGTPAEYRVEDPENDIAEPKKYPDAWDRFLKGNDKATNGWLIEEWGAVTRSFAQNLKSQNIHTVEQLANLSDATAANIMGGIKFRDLAKAALDESATLSLAAKEQERANKAIEENRHLSDQLKALQAEVASLKSEKRGKAA